MTPGTAEQGSIVIEAMIAAAVVAAMLGASFEAIQATGSQSRKIEARREAMLVAQSALATVGTEIPVVPGSTDGTSGALLWRVDIAPTEASAESSVGALDLVTVIVRSPDASAPLATLRTLRLDR